MCGGTTEEPEELQVLFSEYADPVKNQSMQEDITSINGKHIVVTGDFDFG